MQVRNPVAIVGRTANLGEDCSAQKTSPWYDLRVLQMSEDAYRVVGRVSIQLKESALPPAPVMVVVVIDEKHYCVAWGGH